MSVAAAKRLLFSRKTAATMLFVAVALTSSLAAQPKLDVRFGIMVTNSDGLAEFVETTRVPNVPGQVYGWIASIESSVDRLAWTEELRLPRPPLEWDVIEGPAVAVSEDRTTARTTGVVRPTEREFSSFWTITAGDPNGTYSLVLKVFDGVVAECEFSVVASP